MDRLQRKSRLFYTLATILLAAILPIFGPGHHWRIITTKKEKGVEISQRAMIAGNENIQSECREEKNITAFFVPIYMRAEIELELQNLLIERSKKS